MWIYIVTSCSGCHSTQYHSLKSALGICAGQTLITACWRPETVRIPDSGFDWN